MFRPHHQDRRWCAASALRVGLVVPADPALDMLLEDALPVALAGCEKETALGAAPMFGAAPPLSRTVNVEPRPW